MTIRCYNSCAPKALSMLLGQTYEAAVGRIVQAGGNYEAVTQDVFQRLLEPYGIKRFDRYRRPRRFSHLKEIHRGIWVTVVTGKGADTAHCVALRRGKILDNGWIYSARGRIRSLRVHGAWQIAKDRV